MDRTQPGGPSAVNVNFTFSDTVAGYVSSFNTKENIFTVRTSDDREISVYLTANTFSRFTYNLGEGYRDATGLAPSMLALNRQFVFAYGTFYPGSDGADGRFEAQWLVFPGQGPGVYRHEEPDWWINQSRSIGKSYLSWQFNYPGTEIDYKNYRTILHLAGGWRHGGPLDFRARIISGYDQIINETRGRFGKHSEMAPDRAWFSGLQYGT